jgi:peptidyl-prolyl cis-trans isomerase B (cyclophilin B)
MIYSSTMKIALGLLAVIIIVGGAYFLLRGSGTGDTSLSTGTVATSTDSGAQQAQTNSYSTSTPQGQAQSAPQATNNQKIMTATLKTSMGTITIEFYPDQAPKTVENFIKLAQSGYYDGTKFHRVIKGFMDQGGDPLTKDDSQQARWGTGGPGYTIADEFGTTHTNVAGTVAMANTGAPNSGGSQFFLNAVDNHFLDGHYAVFGHVTSGMDVVTKINNTPTAPGDRPVTPVILESVTVK